MTTATLQTESFFAALDMEQWIKRLLILCTNLVVRLACGFLTRRLKTRSQAWAAQ